MVVSGREVVVVDVVVVVVVVGFGAEVGGAVGRGLSENQADLIALHKGKRPWPHNPKLSSVSILQIMTPPKLMLLAQFT